MLTTAGFDRVTRSSSAFATRTCAPWTWSSRRSTSRRRSLPSSRSARSWKGSFGRCSAMHGVELPEPLPDHELCPGHAGLRHRQALRPARAAQAHRAARLARTVDFKVFRAATCRTAGLRRCACRTAVLCRARRSTTTACSSRSTAQRLAWIKVERRRRQEGLQSPIVKFLSEPVLRGSRAHRCADWGRDPLGADRAKKVNDAMGAYRVRRSAYDRGFAEKGWKPLSGRRLPDVRAR